MQKALQWLGRKMDEIRHSIEFVFGRRHKVKKTKNDKPNVYPLW